jgi:transcriptional regulator with XRE-family HTH domain
VSSEVDFPISLHSQRSRLKCSAIDFGKLLGVSAQAIYNWEHEAAPPRGEQLGKAAAPRGSGKRQARERSKQLVAVDGKLPSKL